VARTLIAILRLLQRRAWQRGIDPATIKLTYGKAAEDQRRAVIHLHAIMRPDRIDPAGPDLILPRCTSQVYKIGNGQPPGWETALTCCRDGGI
jgi:hypothetical protein